MPSNSAKEFVDARKRARLLISASGNPSNGCQKKTHKYICLHASVAMLVAAWEYYIESLIKEVQKEIDEPSNHKLSAILHLLSTNTNKRIKKFNTPNSEQSRTLIYDCTGYDPINEWVWRTGQLNASETRKRLDDIMKVRHSFAHGFKIPKDIPWVKDYNVPGVLNVKSLQSVERLLSYLVKSTDSGMKNHLYTVFAVDLKW
jgi:hypothetical protein